MSRLLLFSALNYLFSALCYLKTAFLVANHNREIFSCILLDLKKLIIIIALPFTHVLSKNVNFNIFMSTLCSPRQRNLNEKRGR